MFVTYLSLLFLLNPSAHFVSFFYQRLLGLKRDKNGVVVFCLLTGLSIQL